jgi:hypothetical protein
LKRILFLKPKPAAAEIVVPAQVSDEQGFTTLATLFVPMLDLFNGLIQHTTIY